MAGRILGDAFWSVGALTVLSGLSACPDHGPTREVGTSECAAEGLVEPCNCDGVDGQRVCHDGVFGACECLDASSPSDVGDASAIGDAEVASDDSAVDDSVSVADSASLDTRPGDTSSCGDAECPVPPLSFGLMQGYPTVAEANDVVVGDLDGDGDLDVAVAGGVDWSQGTPRPVAEVEVFLNDGVGGLGSAKAIAGVSQGETVRLADVNHDGVLDLIEVGYGGLGIMLGVGDGQTFTAPVITPTIDGEVDTSVAAADFDGDGNVDLAVGTTGSPPRVFTLRGRGDGTFESAVTLTDPTQQQRLAAVDLDEDGHLDLVSTATRDGLGVLLWRGDGAGHFQTPSNTPVADGLWGPITADLDHDGHLDIVSAAVDNDRLWTLLGDGHGGFTTKRSAVAATTPEQPAVGDFDGDGHLDAATAAAGSQAVLVFRGSASGALSFGLSIAVDASFPNNVAVADLDGDGRPDVLVTCRDRLAVYFNRTGCGGAGEAPCIH